MKHTHNTEGVFNSNPCTGTIKQVRMHTHTQTHTPEPKPAACFGNTSLEAASRHTASHGCMQYTVTHTPKKYIQADTHGYAVRRTHVRMHQEQTQKYTHTHTHRMHIRHKPKTVLDERQFCPCDPHSYWRCTVSIQLIAHSRMQVPHAGGHARTRE